MLGAHEDDREPALLRLEEIEEQRDLVAALGVDEAVVHLGNGALRRRVLVDGGIDGVVGGDAAGLAVERRREEQRLAVGRDLAHDAVDRGLEAHVEHAVGLVEHEDLDLIEAEGAAGEEVLEAARGRDDDVRAGGFAGLTLDADATVDAAMRSARACAMSRDSSTICEASSRVGARIRAAGRAASLASRQSSSGVMNASVLPEPVGLLARTSRPSRMSGSTIACTGSGRS